MMKKKGNVHIGTSGWIYSDWEGVFYPKALSSKDKLQYFSQHFKTTEINYSFYHLPRPNTYQNWYNQTPEDFIFAIKASRFITHIKRLKGVKSAWKKFLENALYLKEKLGPILFQFPPNFKATSENTKGLEEFLKDIACQRRIKAMAFILRCAMEFRHRSWCDDKVYKLLRKYNTSWVIADSPQYPKAEILTADFIYIRVHGSKILFGSKYTKQELRDLAQKIKKWQKSYDVYVYFNNDFAGYAVENAKELTNCVEKYNVIWKLKMSSFFI